MKWGWRGTYIREISSVKSRIMFIAKFVRYGILPLYDAFDNLVRIDRQLYYSRLQFIEQLGRTYGRNVFDG